MPELIVVFTVLLELDPILVSMIYGTGSMMGELIPYHIGLIGRNVEKLTKKYKKLARIIYLIQKNFEKHGNWIIFITALLPFPFVIVSVVAGLSKYSIRKFLIIGFIGKFLKILIMMLLMIKGLDVLIGIIK